MQIIVLYHTISQNGAFWDSSPPFPSHYSIPIFHHTLVGEQGIHHTLVIHWQHWEYTGYLTLGVHLPPLQNGCRWCVAKYIESNGQMNLPVKTLQTYPVVPCLSTILQLSADVPAVHPCVLSAHGPLGICHFHKSAYVIQVPCNLCLPKLLLINLCC